MIRADRAVYSNDKIVEVVKQQNSVSAVRQREVSVCRTYQNHVAAATEGADTKVVSFRSKHPKVWESTLGFVPDDFQIVRITIGTDHVSRGISLFPHTNVGHDEYRYRPVADGSRRRVKQNERETAVRKCNLGPVAYQKGRYFKARVWWKALVGVLRRLPRKGEVRFRNLDKASVLDGVHAV